MNFYLTHLFQGHQWSVSVSQLIAQCTIGELHSW